PGDLTAYAIEAEVGDVVLAATVEASADLDVQVLHGFVGRVALFSDALAELGGETARRGNAELASIGAGARDDINQCPGSGFAETNGVEGLEKLRQVALADPPDHEILLDRGPNGLSGEAADNVAERAELVRRDVAERQSNGDGDVSRLTLRPRIEFEKLLELFGRAVEVGDGD